MYFSVFLFISIVGAVLPFEYVKYDYPGLCPTVSYIKDLDFYQVIGFWYRCFSTLNNPACYNNNGQTVYAYTLSQTLSGLATCCQSSENMSQVICSPDVGSGHISPGPSAGMFNYEFNGQSFNTVVLDADYDNFLISYSCNSELVEQVYVYARSYFQCASLERRVLQVLKRNNIRTKVKRVKHGENIPYTTVPKPCSKQSQPSCNH